MAPSKDTTMKKRQLSKSNSKDSDNDNKKDGGNRSEPRRLPPPRYGPMPNVKNLRLWTRFVMIMGAIAVVYFTSNNERYFAKQKEVLEHRKQHVPCSDLYKKEIDNYPGCIPDNCGRAVMDKLINPSEAEELLELATKGMSLGGSSGGATILDLHSGALSSGTEFVNIYKLNTTGVLEERHFNVYKRVKTKIQEGVAHSFGLSPSSIYLTHPTFFSRLTSQSPTTKHDEYWHPHVDKETYPSFHYTCLIYLNDYGKEFKGGRFIYIHSDNTSLVVEPKKSRVSMFTSGGENVHYVEKVKSGARFAVTVSFTCDKSQAVDDPSLPKQKSKKQQPQKQQSQKQEQPSDDVPQLAKDEL